MNLLMAIMSYSVIAFFWAFFLVRVSILKWKWERPPPHIRALIGILWFAWVLIILWYAIFGKSYKDN